MDCSRVAKITTKWVDGKTRTGTGYPVGANLLLTARHVIEFPERDKTKPVTVEWQNCDKPVDIILDDIKFAFDGGEQLDVVLLCCPIPPAIAASVNHTILEKEKINSRNPWETLGFARVNGFERKGATGMFSVDSADPTIDLTLDNTINEYILQANGIENENMVQGTLI